MAIAAIVLYIDSEDHERECGVALTEGELLRQAGYVNEDAAGMYGYAGYALTLNAVNIQQSDTDWIMADDEDT